MNEEPSNRPPLVRRPSWRRQSQANKVLRWALFYEKESDILAGLGVFGQFRVHEVHILFTTYFEQHSSLGHISFAGAPEHRIFNQSECDLRERLESRCSGAPKRLTVSPGIFFKTIILF